MEVLRHLIPFTEPVPAMLQDISQGWCEVAGLEDTQPYSTECQVRPLYQALHHHPLSVILHRAEFQRGSSHPPHSILRVIVKNGIGSDNVR
jgi:hypothetical protein